MEEEKSSTDASNGSRRVAYVVANELVKVSSLLPSNKGRSLLVHSLVNALGLIAPDSRSSEEASTTEIKSTARIVLPRPASASELCSFHDKDYVDMLLSPVFSTPPERLDAALEEYASSLSEFGLEDDCPSFSGLNAYVRLVGGATLTATRELASGNADISICWDGGRHHAQKSRASGFCYVADCVLAILLLKKAPVPLVDGDKRKSRIMYLDLDLHYSDGVSHAFRSSNSTMNSSTPQVLTLSIHHYYPGFFPPSQYAELPNISTTFDPFSLSIPLLKGASSRTFARIWPIVENVRKTFQPDYVVLQCGVDGLAGDPHKCWNWQIGLEEGQLGWCIAQVLNNWGCKTLLLGGGGYNSPNAARAWAHLTSIAVNNPIPLDTQIPDHASFPLYAPGFTMDVVAGNMLDENTDDYLDEICAVYKDVTETLRSRMET